MKRRLLFAWELGAGTGHVSPYIPLLQCLQARGWEITVAVRDTAEVASLVRSHEFTLLQAPVSTRLFPGLDSTSYNYTETLLHFGYGDPQTLRGLSEAWVSLCDLVRPDLILCSAAPTLQFVAQCLGIPHAMIGSGYNCPPATRPLPLFRDWAPGVEQRLQNAEATVGSVLSTVREQVFRRTGPLSIQQLLSDSPAFLCTFHELDHYPAREAGAEYCGILSARRYPALAEAPCDVFAYLRGAQGETVVSALAQSKLRALVYWPDAPDAAYQRFASEHLTISPRAVKLDQVIGGCRFVIGYGSHHLTAEALLAGKPLLLLPNHLEQELTCRAVERMGAGISNLGKARRQKPGRLLTQMIEDESLHAAAQAFAAQYEGWSAERSTEALAEHCEHMVSSHSAVVRKVVAL
ncbi:MAG: hypothetical protein SF172_15655 [Burkholderiales bacterium]|nr:hypothetical protein [Burkholderiales bacterium]